MKKILSLIIAFVLILSCFSVTAFAEDMAIGSSNSDYTASFSENYRNLYVNGEQFSRIDSTMLLTDTSYYVFMDEEYGPDEEFFMENRIDVELTDEQKKEVKEILFEGNYHKNIFRVSITFKDGSTLIVIYLKDTYLEEYNRIVNSNPEQYVIDFTYPDGNYVYADKNAIFGETVIFSASDMEHFSYMFNVSAQSSDGSIIIEVGVLFQLNDEYYYVDYNEINSDGYISWDGIDAVVGNPVHKVTDAELLAEIENAMQNHYDDDFGLLYDDDATESIGKIFLIAVFGILPLAFFVLFLVKAIKGKGTYKKLYITIASLCMATVIVFVILAVIVGVSGNSSESLVGGVDDSQLSADTFLETNDDTTTLELLELMVSDADTVMVKKAEYCGNMDCPDGCLEGTFCIRKDYAVDEAMSQFGIGEPDGNYKYYNEKTMETSIITDMIEYENGYLVEYKIISIG